MNRQKRILIELPKEESFDVPEGIYRVVTRDVYPINKPFKELSAQTLRIKWHIPALDEATVEYMIAKNYPLSLDPRLDLRKDLNSWLGQDGIKDLLIDGKLAVDKLIGIEADVYTQHGPDRGFKHPFVNITSIAPPGTYVGSNQGKVAPCLKSIKELLR